MLQERRPGLLLAVLLVPCLLTPTEKLEAQTTGMVEFFAGGRLQKGLPLVDLTHELIVIARDGGMHSIDPRKPESQVRSLGEPYIPASILEIRNDLQSEFGRDFEVLSTQSFLIVQPRGRGDRWARMFEQSHRGFITYMGKRSVQVRQGRFPMVAIVFPDETSMYREFEKLDIQVKRVAGLYSGDSNRVMTHDGGQSAQIAATVRHEAAHQSAFNSGIHSRVNDTPRWITEGIGQMFEPAALTDTRGARRLIDRVNQDSFRYLQKNFQSRKDQDVKLSETVMQLISDDSMFENQKQIDDAYAVAWAMMFYLAERDPEAFAKILNHTAKRPPFQPYTRSHRLRDFERIAGVDTFEFSKRVSWFLDSL